MTTQPKAAPDTPAADALDKDVQAHCKPDFVEFTAMLGKGSKAEPYTFVVSPIEVRNTFPFLALARPMLAALARSSSPPSVLPPAGNADPQGGAASENPLAGMDANQLAQAVQDGDRMIALVTDHGAELVQALAVGIDEPQDKVGQLRLPDLVTLVKHFIVVNADFLKARGLALPPGLLGFAGVVQPAVAKPKR